MYKGFGRFYQSDAESYGSIIRVTETTLACTCKNCILAELDY